MIQELHLLDKLAELFNAEIFHPVTGQPADNDDNFPGMLRALTIIKQMIAARQYEFDVWAREQEAEELYANSPERYDSGR